jgi:hypothetical protein
MHKSRPTRFPHSEEHVVLHKADPGKKQTGDSVIIILTPKTCWNESSAIFIYAEASSSGMSKKLFASNFGASAGSMRS